MGLTLGEMEELTFGFILDLMMEANNDECEYQEQATQADFDKF